MGTGPDIGDFYFIDKFMAVKHLKTYIKLVQDLFNVFQTLDIKSDGIRNLAKQIEAVHNSDEFANLHLNSTHMYSLLEKDIKSVTVGINLENGIGLTQMGIVSLNEESYKSTSLINKLLSNNPTPYTLITQIMPDFAGLLSKDQKLLATQSFKNAFNTFLKNIVKDIPREITLFMKRQTQFLVDLAPEICFLIAGYEMIMNLKNQGALVCKPDISQTNSVYIESLYHPILLETSNWDEMVCNSISFDDNGMLYVLTGANSGGKSVFLHSIGIAQVLFQLGLYVPAKNAVMLPIDNICIHFPSELLVQDDGGRLEYECKAVTK